MMPAVIIIIGIVLAASLMGVVVLLWSDMPEVKGDDFDEPQSH